LWENGIVTVKFFLHLSKGTQRKRFLERIDKKDKNWKFSASDLQEREYWDEYREAYQTAIEKTATDKNPWYIVPADKKWYTRAVISEVLLHTMKKIDPAYPTISEEQTKALEESRRKLLEES
jgi:polyphosphate kinase 2 (PPK2 family)